MENFETRSVNSMTVISPTLTRKLLSGDGAILIQDLYNLITADLKGKVSDLSGEVSLLKSLDQTLSDRVDVVDGIISSIETTLNDITNSLSNITTGSLMFNGIRMALVQDGKVVPEEYGYMVMKKSSTGKLTFSALSESEFKEIFPDEEGGTENE